MNTFWKLLKESVITQALLTLMVWGAIIYMTCNEKTVPSWLIESGLFILGFFFGAKTRQVITTEPIATIGSLDKKG